VPRAATSGALSAAATLLDQKGTGARDQRNMVVFMAADQRRLEDLRHAVAEFLAWQSINDDAGADGLNLDPQQARQAATRRDEADRATDLRMTETYQWVLVPSQPDPNGPVAWDHYRADGEGAPAERASRRLINEGVLYADFAPSLLRRRLDGVLAPLWGAGAVDLTRLWDVLCRYLYLPRLRDQEVLRACVTAGPASLTWQQDGFAVADSVDSETGRYRGLVTGAMAPVVTPATLVVRPDVAEAQRQADAETQPQPAAVGQPVVDPTSGDTGEAVAVTEATAKRPTRFYGVATLDAERLNRDFAKLSQEIVVPLTGLLGTAVTVVVEIVATRQEGFEEHTVRTISENANALRLGAHGFEEK